MSFAMSRLCHFRSEFETQLSPRQMYERGTERLAESVMQEGREQTLSV